MPSCANRARSSADATLSLMTALSRATTEAGVPAGATTPSKLVTMKPATPLSIMVGRSGRDGKRFAVLYERQHAFDCAEHHRHLTADESRQGVRQALVGHVHDVDAGLRLEPFGRQMGGVAVAG